MLTVQIETLGDLTAVECKGRIVRSEAVFKLRDTVMSQSAASIIVLDLSEVEAIGGGAVGMLGFLHLWARDQNTQLKLFNPRQSVRDRLEQVHSMREFDIATFEEMMALLARTDSRYAQTA